MRSPDLQTLCELIQDDVGGRGLRTDPADNLVTACPGDFAAACAGIAEHPAPAVGVLTGFFIPHAQPPCGETDGPLGALFLARALAPLGVRVVLLADPFGTNALAAGLAACDLARRVRLVTLPGAVAEENGSVLAYRQYVAERSGSLTHLIALERVGPSHTAESVRAQPGATEADVRQFCAEVSEGRQGRAYTMKGRDITWNMSPAHLLFEPPADERHPLRSASGLTTIGIGDGGNEIGMGKVRWSVVRRNIPGGGLVACRVATDHLIVCGVSNWGAYGLAAGVRLLKGAGGDGLFDADRERELLRVMVERGPLVDGVTGKPTVTVDGLSFERYAEPLVRLGACLERPLA